MRVSFTKMHGLGNDFIMLDGRDNALPVLASPAVRALSDRKTGIGCDQLIVLEPSTNADFRMRIFNADGGEVEACGNASRAVALLHGKAARVETSGGIIDVAPAEIGARVDMGIPRFEWDAIPLAYAMDTLSMPVGWDTLENPVGINVGNPHVVFFVDNADDIALGQLGPVIEQDPLFPERVNVNVASLSSENALKLHVWERGVGLTRACGTGACATAIAAMRRGITARTVDVTLPGGTLAIEWDDNDRIIMTGPASESFRGSFEWDDFA
ncbi:diaminopimelate epimerase [Parerythrobacter jejuensis]|uniref:Diaminopimelate epimerase n=1 Tax=Parerythrobacter jejuensis TaxID=795812 RepID=A0A845ASV1_9SPHN|nr:diaminopimelate epimerase [Parerythrobacter jejuensis]MXP32065.1 diaminopimelate epimerase [Parerythrobacter jejuensis]